MLNVIEIPFRIARNYFFLFRKNFFSLFFKDVSRIYFITQRNDEKKTGPEMRDYSPGTEKVFTKT